MVPPTESDRTLGEVARRLDEVMTRYEQIANDLPKTFVSRELFDSYKDLVKTQQESSKVVMDAYEKRIGDLEDDKKWLYRLIVGAVILALLGLVLGASGGFHSSPAKKASSVMVVAM